jgi:hypothetical protein
MLSVRSMKLFPLPSTGVCRSSTGGATSLDTMSPRRTRRLSCCTEKSFCITPIVITRDDRDPWLDAEFLSSLNERALVDWVSTGWISGIGSILSS